MEIPATVSGKGAGVHKSQRVIVEVGNITPNLATRSNALFQTVNARGKELCSGVRFRFHPLLNE